MADVVQPINAGGQAAQFAPLLNWASGQAVSYTGTAGQSTAIVANAVIVTATTDCYIAVGSNPTAAAGAGSDFLAAGVKWGLTIVSGQKISAVRVADSGALYILPALAD